MENLSLTINVGTFCFERKDTIYIAKAYADTFIIVSSCEMKQAGVKCDNDFKQIAETRIADYEFVLMHSLAKRLGYKISQ